MALILCSFDNKIKMLYRYYFIFLLLSVFKFFFNYKIKNEDFDDHNLLFTDPISRVLLIIPYIIYNKCISSKYNNRFTLNFATKDWIIFILIFFIHFFYNVFYLFGYYFGKLDNSYDYMVECSTEFLIIIFLSILMKFVSNFRFYSHHVASVIIAFIFTIIFGIIFFYKSNYYLYIYFSQAIINVLIIIFYYFLECIYITYHKYLLDKTSISFLIVCSFYGFIDFIFIFAGYFILNINFSISDYIDRVIIFEIIINIICFSLFFYFYYRIIYEYNIIYAEILSFFFNTIESLSNAVIYKKYKYKSSLIILEGIFILVCLLIYDEIIELNFCKLNKNTRRNILIREKRESLDLDQTLSELLEDVNIEKNEKFEISNGYLIDLDNNQNESDIIN